jgi:hypothetical protein
MSFQTETCPEQDKVADVRTQRDHALVFFQRGFKMTNALDVDYFFGVFVVRHLHKTIQKIRNEVFLNAFRQPFFG